MTNTELSGGDADLLVQSLRAKVAALEAELAGRQQAVPSGWVPLLIEYDPGYPEEVAFGPQRMMDRLKLWLDKYFAMPAAAPQADSSPLLAKLDISGIGRDAGHPRAVLLYLRHEPSDDDLRTIQEMFRTAYPTPTPAAPDVAGLADLCAELMTQVEGELPTLGYLRDNNKSRETIGRIKDALATFHREG